MALELVFSVHIVVLLVLYSTCALILLIRFRCRMDKAMVFFMFVTWFNFVVKSVNWYMLDFSSLSYYGVFKTIDTGSGHLITLMLYYFTYEMLIVKSKL